LFLNAAEIREMANNGIDFGSHTVSHSILTGLPSAAIEAEVTESNATLETIVGRRINTLAYPNGDCSDEVVQCVRAAGFRVACTTRNARISKTDDPLRLPRVEPEWDFPNGDDHFDETMFRWRSR